MNQDTHNVLYLNTPVYLGGAEISLLALMVNLDPQRYRALLLTVSEGALTERCRRGGVRVLQKDLAWPTWRRPWKYPNSIFQLARTIRNQSVALVHTNCDYSMRYASLACRMTGVPFIAHVRDFVRAWFQSPHLDALKRANRVVANSHAIAQACQEAGIEPARIRVIYNPVDVASFQRPLPEAARALRHELSISPDALAVGIVGQISPIKGHEDFIAAAHQVLERLPGAQFIICGAANTDGVKVFEARLRQMVQDSSSDGFHFTGFRNDIPTMLQALDVLVVPSWSEPFGRVVVEGLAAGCPVVATRAGGIPEIVEDGVTALLVPPKNPPLLAKAILRLAIDHSLREKLVKNGSLRAQDFGIEQHVHRVQDLYDEVRVEVG